MFKAKRNWKRYTLPYNARYNSTGLWASIALNRPVCVADMAGVTGICVSQGCVFPRTHITSLRDACAPSGLCVSLIYNYIYRRKNQ